MAPIRAPTRDRAERLKARQRQRERRDEIIRNFAIRLADRQPKRQRFAVMIPPPSRHARLAYEEHVRNRMSPPCLLAELFKPERDSARATLEQRIDQVALDAAGISQGKDWADLNRLIQTRQVSLDCSINSRRTYLKRMKVMLTLLRACPEVASKVTRIEFLARYSSTKVELVEVDDWIPGAKLYREHLVEFRVAAKLLRELLRLCPNAREFKLEALSNDSFADLVDLIVAHRPNATVLDCSTKIGGMKDGTVFGTYKIDNVHISPRRLVGLVELKHLALNGVYLNKVGQLPKGHLPAYELESFEYSFTGEPLLDTTLEWMLGQSNESLTSLTLRVSSGTHGKHRYAIGKTVFGYLNRTDTLPNLLKLRLLHHGEYGKYATDFGGPKNYFAELFRLADKDNDTKIQVAFEPEKLNCYTQLKKTVENDLNEKLYRKLTVLEGKFRRGPLQAKTEGQQRKRINIERVRRRLAQQAQLKSQAKKRGRPKGSKTVNYVKKPKSPNERKSLPHYFYDRGRQSMDRRASPRKAENNYQPEPEREHHEEEEEEEEEMCAIDSDEEDAVDTDCDESSDDDGIEPIYSPARYAFKKRSHVNYAEE